MTPETLVALITALAALCANLARLIWAARRKP